MFTAIKHHGIVIFALAVISWGGLAYGQRQRFPTPVPVNTVANSTAAPPSTFSQAPAAAAQTYGQPAYGTTAPSAAPYMGGPTGAPYGGGVGGTVPGAAPGAATPYSPMSPYPGGQTFTPGAVPVTPGVVPGPTAAPMNGGVVLPPPQWDPYAPPGAMQQPVLLPQDPYIPGSPSETIVQVRRLLDDLRLDYTFLSASGDKKFGCNDLDLSATFAFPFFKNQETPFLVTPGFTFHWWDGPSSAEYTAMPARVYDAYLTSAWNPMVTPYVGGELEFTVGVYSDFKKVDQESLRYTGTGLLVFNFSPSMTIKAGIVYYDRVKIKLLPAGGLFWHPSPETRFDFYFPEPRFATRLQAIGNTEWWFYVRGEYGGGSWLFEWSDLGNVLEQADYNDIRVAMGLEFSNLNVLSGHIEFGVAFNREIIPRGPVVLAAVGEYKPSTTFFLGAGLSY